MTSSTLSIRSANVGDTNALAAILSRCLHPGQCVLLTGAIGAGKSTLARAFIRARLGNPHEDVPSPTFTLVQVYDHPDGDIWHCDLYRLTDPQEAVELGLDEALQTAICLIEWPDRMGDLAPPDALVIKMAAQADSHAIDLTGPSALIEHIAAAHD